MMKRFVTMLCIFCLLGSFAQAEGTSTPLHVLDGWWAAEAYQERYPDREIEAWELTWDDKGNSNEWEILQSGQWDAACIDTADFSLSELDRLGLTLDLGSKDACAEVADRLYPSIRTGCSVGERLLALPAGYLGMRAYKYRLIGTDYQGEEDAEGVALRERLGFTAEDQPTTFAEVCELGLRYMALDRATRKGSIFLYSDSSPQGYSLLNLMIGTYQAQATDENGKINFDTPAFREALTAADPLLAAFAADPKRTYDQKGKFRVVLDTGVGVEAYGALPQVVEDTKIPALMTVVIVNPNSEKLSEAVDYALTACEQGDSTLPLLLYQNADYDALLEKSYDETIAAQIEEREDESVIKELEALKAAKDDKYFIPKSVVVRYATEIASNLSFPRWKSISTDKAIFDYLHHKTDADGLIAALNQSAEK